MAKLSTDELLDAFKELTLIELSEFVKQFEDTFGVTAAAPVAVAAAAPAAGGGDGAAAEEEESDEVDVILEAAGDKKIQVIKEVRTAHQPGPEGGQGTGRGRAEGRLGEGHQGSRQQGEGSPRGRRRLGHRQVRSLRLGSAEQATTEYEARVAKGARSSAAVSDVVLHLRACRPGLVNWQGPCQRPGDEYDLRQGVSI